MALYRFTVAASFDTLLPEDAIVNDLYYTRIVDDGDDEGLCTDIAEVFDNFWYNTSHPKITVKMYDQGAGNSGPPRASASINGIDFATSTGPREVALCLSFWASNRADPHRRGRIYLMVAGRPETDMDGVRPGPALITAALNLGDELAGIGGADVSWQVYSRTQNNSEDVTNTWVDNEWDTIRSRGMKPTASVVRNV